MFKATCVTFEKGRLVKGGLSHCIGVLQYGLYETEPEVQQQPWKEAKLFAKTGAGFTKAQSLPSYLHPPHQRTHNEVADVRICVNGQVDMRH